jgi:hypothetical protein
MLNNKKLLEKIDKIIKTKGIPKYIKKFKSSTKLRNEIINYPHKDNKFCSLLEKYVNNYHHHSHIRCNFFENKLNKNKFEIPKHLPKKIKDTFFIARPEPEFSYDTKTKIGKIVFYKFLGFLEKNTLDKDYIKHIKLVQEFLNKYTFNGLILDLRLHQGGIMWTTLIGLKLIIQNIPLYIFTKSDSPKKDDLYLSIDNKPFISKEKFRTKEIKLTTTKLNVDYPIAIIIGKYTYSSGELIASAFSGKDNVKIFGKRSGGGLSSNETIYLTKDIEFIFTSELVRLTNGIFKEHLEPDIKTNTPITDAKKWILGIK